MSGLVFVAGSLHLDIVIEAPHLPAIDETVMGGPTRFVCGGKGGNQAVAAAMHGARVAFGGCVGQDWFGARLEANLAEAGIDLSMLQRCEQSSGMSVAIVDRNADYGAVVASGANLAFDASACAVPPDTAIVLLQNEIAEAANLAIARKAREAGATVMLNAAPARPLPPELMACVDVLIVNRVEAAAWLGSEADTASALVERLRRQATEPATIIVTIGADGLVYRGTDCPPLHLPGFTVQSVSNHGAGDTFVGALAARHADGIAIAEALQYAQAAAAHFVATPPQARGRPDPAAIQALMAAGE